MTVPSEWVLNQLLGKIASGFGGKGESLKVITVTPFDLSKLTTPSNCFKRKEERIFQILFMVSNREPLGGL